MLNIGIDGNEANLNQRVGVGQYAYNIILQLSKLDSKNNYHIYLKSPPIADMPPESPRWHYHVFGPQKLWTKIALPFHLFFDRIKLDLFYSPTHYSPHFCPFPTIPTIHDLGYLSTQDQFTKKDLYQLTEWTKHSLFQARHVMAVSQFTKSEINRIYGINKDKISVAYNGITKPTINTDSAAVLKKFNITKPYYLYLGTLKPSKNISFLIEAFAQTSGFELVIAGKKGWLFSSIFDTVKKFNLQKSVIFTDYISETEKWILYREATATVLPSLYEGFGIPAIESQLMGTPVICSDIPVFKEILGSTATYIDPHSVDSLATSLKNNTIKAKKQYTNRFTWEKSALSLIEVFSKI